MRKFAYAHQALSEGTGEGSVVDEVGRVHVAITSAAFPDSWALSITNPSPVSDPNSSETRGAHLKTARAWALKESLRELWDYRHESRAAEFWKRWYFWATHSRLAPMIDAAKMIARHLPNVLTYFKHRISNAVAEGLNSKVATIQKRACGYRNAEHFKIAAYFHCGGLLLWPQRWTHSEVG